jgi:hypothetical protein
MLFVSEARASLIPSDNITNHTALAYPKGLATDIGGDILTFVPDDRTLATGFVGQTIIQFAFPPPDETNSNVVGMGLTSDAAAYKAAANTLVTSEGPFVLTGERPPVSQGPVRD